MTIKKKLTVHFCFFQAEGSVFAELTEALEKVKVQLSAVPYTDLKLIQERTNAF